MTQPAVLFVNPWMCAPHSARLPLSIMHLAAVLPADQPWRIIDGNVDPDAVKTALATLSERPHAAVGVTVMPGPQIPTAIELSRAIRAAHPTVPIVWGGYFPTMYPDVALNAPYVDYVVRGQGEATFLELLARVDAAGPPTGLDSATDASVIEGLAGVSWKRAGCVVHNDDRPVVPPDRFGMLPYERIIDARPYLRRSFMGQRTTVHQAALGCRYRCDFCGVVSMWNGTTLMDAPDRLRASLVFQREHWGADAVQFYDHNFFDDEGSALPIIDVIGEVGLAWWCYARADTLAGFSDATWAKLKRSKLRMTYIGAEAASDEALKRMHKGSRVDATMEVAMRAKEHGIIPELSFVLGGPEDPEEEIERTFRFIRALKAKNPACEIILYYYSPSPQREARHKATPGRPRLPILKSYGPAGPPPPATPEEWATDQWIRYACHQDSPWLTPHIRQRVRDFGRVLGCRFPTVQDYETPAWGKAVLRNLARWRYARERYDRPWELAVASKLIPLRRPERESL